jgi:hypothetical protein
MDNFDDLFNIDPTKVFTTPAAKKSSDLYKPMAKDGKEGTYKSIIRFVPWHKDPSNTIVAKWNLWLTDPLSGSGMSIDCPSSIGEKSILQETYYKLKNSSNVEQQKLAQNFSRRQVFFAPIQILKDENRPELEGQLKIFQFGVKLHKKILEVMNPDPNDRDALKNNVLDLFTGLPLRLMIETISGFNNYDRSAWGAAARPIIVDGKEMERNVENMTTIRDFLVKNTPDLDKFKFRPWDEKTTEFVNNCISHTFQVSSNGGALDSVVSSTSNNYQRATSTSVSAAELIESTLASPAGSLTDSLSDSDIDDLLSSTDDDLFN